MKELPDLLNVLPQYAADRSIAPTTLTQLRAAVNSFTKFVGSTGIGALTDTHMLAWRKAMKDEASASTVRSYMRGIRSLWRYLHDAELIATLPKSPKLLTEYRGPLFDLLDEMELERSLRSTTQWGMQAAVVTFVRFCGRDSLDELNARTVSEFVRYMEAEGMAPTTRRGYRNYIISLWKFAYIKGMVAERCEAERIRSVKVPYKNPVAFTREEVAALVHTAESMRSRPLFGSAGRYAKAMQGTPFNLYWGALLRVAWDSAFRRSDLLTGLYKVDGLQWSEINLRDDGSAYVLRSQAKTGQPVEAILSPRTVEAMQAIRTTDDAVFYWPASSRRFIGMFEEIRAAAKLPNGKEVRRLPFKCIRRASCTDVAQRNLADASRQAGHVPGSTMTPRHYIDFSQIITDRERPTDLEGEA